MGCVDDKRRLLALDLQFFGDEKTEEATSKKLSDTRDKGQVAKSQELSNAVSLIFVFLLLRIVGFYIGTQFLEFINWVYEGIPEHVVLTNGEVSVKDFCNYINTDDGTDLFIIKFKIMIQQKIKMLLQVFPKMMI